MTVDELRERKAELLARKKYELDLKARGEGDPLALFMVNEELLEVEEHIRWLSLSANRPPAPKIKIGSDKVRKRAMEKQVFLEWCHCESNADSGEIAEKTRVTLRTCVSKGEELLTARQKEVFDLWRSGLKVIEIASRLNLSKASVSRTLARAKARMNRIADVRLESEHAAGQGLQVRGIERGKSLAEIISLKQMISLYLRYAMRLSIPRISSMLQVGPSTVSRAVSRAVGKINKTLDADPTAAGNEEKMDAVLLAIYRTLCTRIAEIPEPVRAYIKEQPSPGYVRTVSRVSRAKDQGGKMNIIKIAPHANGGHNNQSWCGPNIPVPDGFAIVPVDPKTLENFPFGTFEVEEIDGQTYMKADTWVPGTTPEPEPDPVPDSGTEPTVWDELDAAYTEGVNAAYDQ